MSDLLLKTIFGSHSITILNVAVKKINQTGATALAEVLKVNSSITTLDLCQNKIDSTGVRALTGALKINSLN